MVESPELKRSKAEIKRLNEELEQRIVERTRELVAANEELREGSVLILLGYNFKEVED